MYIEEQEDSKSTDISETSSLSTSNVSLADSQFSSSMTDLDTSDLQSRSRWGTVLASTRTAEAVDVKSKTKKPAYRTSVSAQVELKDRIEPWRRRASNDSVIDRKTEAQPSTSGVTFRDKASLFTTQRLSSDTGASPSKPTEFTKPNHPESTISNPPSRIQRSSAIFTHL